MDIIFDRENQVKKENIDLEYSFQLPMKLTVTLDDIPSYLIEKAVDYLFQNTELDLCKNGVLALACWSLPTHNLEKTITREVDFLSEIQRIANDYDECFLDEHFPALKQLLIDSISVIDTYLSRVKSDDDDDVF